MTRTDSLENYIIYTTTNVFLYICRKRWIQIAFIVYFFFYNFIISESRDSIIIDNLTYLRVTCNFIWTKRRIKKIIVIFSGKWQLIEIILLGNNYIIGSVQLNWWQESNNFFIFINQKYILKLINQIIILCLNHSCNSNKKMLS